MRGRRRSDWRIISRRSIVRQMSGMLLEFDWRSVSVKKRIKTEIVVDKFLFIRLDGIISTTKPQRNKKRRVNLVPELLDT